VITVESIARKKTLERDREALSGLHVKFGDLSWGEYNAVLHAIWMIDRELQDMKEREVSA
jgi:hypothetical protein